MTILAAGMRRSWDGRNENETKTDHREDPSKETYGRKLTRVPHLQIYTE